MHYFKITIVQMMGILYTVTIGVVFLTSVCQAEQDYILLDSTSDGTMVLSYKFKKNKPDLYDVWMKFENYKNATTKYGKTILVKSGYKISRHILDCKNKLFYMIHYERYSAYNKLIEKLPIDPAPESLQPGTIKHKIKSLICKE